MDTLIEDMLALGVRNRSFFLVENGSWAPTAGRLMEKKLSTLKNCVVSEDIFTFKSALHSNDEERLSEWISWVTNEEEK